MTKHYFISYMFQTNIGVAYSSCLYTAVDKTLNDIYADLARFKDVAPESVVITCLKDLTKKEYKMLKGDEEQPR